MAAGWLNSSEEICPPNTKVWESGWDERERGDKRSIDTLTLPCILLPGFAHVTLRRRRLPPGICDEKVGPFSAHKTASGNLCPKGWPFLATDAFGAVLKCNCYSFWPGIWTYKWVFISNVCLFMGLWTFLWLQAFAKSKHFTFEKVEYLNFYKVQIFEQDGKKGGKRKWDKSDKWDKARCQQCCAGVQDKDSTHTRPSHSALITSINCFRRNKCVDCSPGKWLFL